MPNRPDRSDCRNLYDRSAPFKAKPAGAPRSPEPEDGACLADRPAEQSVAWLPDPTVMIGVLALCAWLQALGASLAVSTYVPVVLAAGVVTWCEWLWPHRPARRLDLPVSALWPHLWPVWVQAVLMVLVVDFLRYWMHRASHENDTL